MNDLKELLVKYITHVGMMEGVDFIPKSLGHTSLYGRVSDMEGFTLEELEVLWECTGWDEDKGEYVK